MVSKKLFGRIRSMAKHVAQAGVLHSHRSRIGSHAGQAAKRKARNRKRNKIARASRRANRA